MSDGVSAQLLAMLHAGELDVVIGSLDDGSCGDDELQQLRFESLYEDTITFVTSADTPGLEGPVNLAELCQLTWVLSPRSSRTTHHCELSLLRQADQGVISTIQLADDRPSRAP